MNAANSDTRPLTIIGSGPAGYTAAIYAARAGLRPILVASSFEAGGDLAKTTDVDNFPGFPEGIMGPDLMQKMKEQAERFKTEVLAEDAERVELASPVKKVFLASGRQLSSQAIIIATGSAYRKLGLPGEEPLTGKGVSWCATCDGFFFRDKDVAVVGGGDSAMEEATFLARFARKVYLVHRSDRLRASQTMQQRAHAEPKIEFVFNFQVEKLEGQETLTGVKLASTCGEESRNLEVQGLFIAVGSDPRTELVRGQLELTDKGTIAVQGRSSKTSLPGVFAAGDVVDPLYRQAVTAAASGTVAALDAQHFLDAQQV